jgi:phage shock protein PspC (stress-responsive transcriptional regulator)
LEGEGAGQKRLCKSSRHRIVAGVLGGIAEYLGVDPNILRLIFVVVLFLNFYAALALYVAAAILLPSESEKGAARMPIEKAVLAVAATIMVFIGLSFVSSLAEVQKIMAMLGFFTPIVGLVLLIAGVALLIMVLREQSRPRAAAS